jgi:hypothetical protein
MAPQATLVRLHHYRCRDHLFFLALDLSDVPPRIVIIAGVAIGLVEDHAAT